MAWFAFPGHVALEVMCGEGGRLRNRREEWRVREEERELHFAVEGEEPASTRADFALTN